MSLSFAPSAALPPLTAAQLEAEWVRGAGGSVGRTKDVVGGQAPTSDPKVEGWAAPAEDELRGLAPDSDSEKATPGPPGDVGAAAAATVPIP